MSSLLQDLRYAIRLLIRNPLFTIVSVLTLALGIGANSAIFSAVYEVLFKPLPYKNPDSLVVLFNTREDGSLMTMSPLDFQDISSSGVFEQTAAMDTFTLDLTGKGEPERISAAAVSWNFFRVLGVQTTVGRSFNKDEGALNAGDVVVLGYGLWQRRFAGDPAVAGSTVLLDGKKRQVIGIAPREFTYPAGVEIWKPLVFSADELDPSQRGARWLRTIGRVSPGISMDQALERVSVRAKELQRLYPEPNSKVGATLQPLHSFLVRKTRPALLVLWGAVGFVLLISCVNVTNLVLSQAAGRSNEIAIRSALGAGRLRLMRQFLIESIVLASLAGAAGLLIGMWATDLLSRFGSVAIPSLADLHLNLRIVAYSALISIGCGVVIGSIPVWQDRSINVTTRAGMRITSRNRLRKALAVMEIALAIILLTGAVLLIKSFSRLMQIDPGFRSGGVLAFEVSLPDARYSELHQSSSFFAELNNRLRIVPGVKTSAAVFGLPLSRGFAAATSFNVIGKPETDNEPVAGLRVITPHYLEAMRIPLKAGRSFNERDTNESGDVVIVSEAAAKTYWPGENAIGRQLRIHVGLVERVSKPRTIVGIVKDVRFEGFEIPPQPDLYIPHTQQPLNSMMVVVRTSGNTESLYPIIRQELRKMDSDLPLSNVKSMEDIVSGALSQRKFTMLLLSSFAVLGLFLAGLGTYGVLSFRVVQQKEEIGIRMALGAQKGDVVKLVLKEGATIAATGSILGIVAFFAVARFLRSLLYEVSSVDPYALLTVVTLLSAVALLACYLPAYRASKLDPLSTIRYE